VLARVYAILLFLLDCWKDAVEGWQAKDHAEL